MKEAWPTLMGDYQRTGYRAEECKPPLELAWKYQLGGYIWGSPIILGERVYMAQDRVYAFDLRTGNIIWETNDYETIRVTSGLDRSDFIFIGGYSNHLLLNAEQGKIEATWPIKTANSTAFIHDKTIYCYGIRQLYAIDLESRKLRWQRSCDGVQYSPSSDGKWIYWAEAGSLTAIDMQQGNTIWQIPLPQKNPLGYVSVKDGMLYLGLKQQGGIIALDAQTGRLQWHVQHGEDAPYFTTPICVTDRYLYLGGLQGLYAFERSTGDLVWHQTDSSHHIPQYQGLILANSAPICIGKTIYIGGGNSLIIGAFDADTGEPLWCHETEDLVFCTPSYANGHLLIGSHDGYLYCFRQQNAG